MGELFGTFSACRYVNGWDRVKELVLDSGLSRVSREKWRVGHGLSSEMVRNPTMAMRAA